MTDFTWSYSSLKEYENCPRKYHQMRVLQNYKIEPTPQMIYGTEVHKALEDYVKRGQRPCKKLSTF
jgi:hypothetical protein